MSGNRLGLAYCFRPWGRLDSEIGEPRKYGEGHKWGTSGSPPNILAGRIGISNSFYTGRFC